MDHLAYAEPSLEPIVRVNLDFTSRTSFTVKL